ncbi:MULTISPECIES: carboxymuconolactone decarboxylase family protein [Tsukamurella]|uniref:Carboxymuconolactone decarboxylase family protein n=2 Tax=Tsukamurella TaxID=2060 RepID=A0A5C5S8G3_9ACTN|nr:MULTISPECIES: carboxymuconolactone decarboxylase family protein [Tsukamurella]NMD55392.1 carboxymuconolactone decarboxylase family protein [Tsukamurella columbiensis]TWS30651.1 carboxymuconolactone decarboxylase family protein [Tsukamurella conjunctivitidis]
MPAQRVRIDKASPRIYKQLIAVSTEVAAAAEAAGIGRDVVELVNLRCSQLNGCAYCLDLHARAGRAAGLTDQQLDVVAAWREAPALFDDMQRAALEIAELVTELPPHHAADIAYDRATDVLDEAQTSVLIWAAVTINAFNRVSVVSGYEVRHRV